MMKRGLLVASSLLVAVTAVRGQVVSCGFDSPEYQLGALGGQAGWSVSPMGVSPMVAMVVSSPRSAGDHAARLDQSAEGSEFDLAWGCNVALGPSQRAMDIEWRMRIGLGGGFGWVIDLIAPGGARLAWLWIDGGNMWYRVWSAEPLPADGFMSADTWHTMRVHCDWGAQTTEIFMDGQSIASSGWRGNRGTGLSSFGVRAVVGGSSDTAVLDSITVTPLTMCAADFNHDGVVSSQDFFDYLNEFFASRPGADVNSDGVVNSQDFFDYLGELFGGCV